MIPQATGFQLAASSQPPGSVRDQFPPDQHAAEIVGSSTSRVIEATRLGHEDSRKAPLVHALSDAKSGNVRPEPSAR